jgi:hypothetical protein
VYPPPTTTVTTAKVTPTPSSWTITLVNVLNHGDPVNMSSAAPITYILPMPNNVYTGDEEGRVVCYSSS